MSAEQRISRQYPRCPQSTGTHSFSPALSLRKVSIAPLGDPNVFCLSLVPGGIFHAFIILSLKNCFLNSLLYLLILNLHHLFWAGKNSSDWHFVPIKFLLACITYLITAFLSSTNFFLGSCSPKINILLLKNVKTLHSM